MGWTRRPRKLLWKWLIFRSAPVNPTVLLSNSYVKAKTMKRHMLAMILVSTMLTGHAFGESAIQSAEHLKKAILNLDVETMVSLMHPSQFNSEDQKSGTPVESMRNSMTKLRSEGMTVRDYKLRAPTAVVESQGKLFQVIPTEIELEIKGETTSSKTFLLGVSEDGGDTWKFLDQSACAQIVGKPNSLIPDGLKLPWKQ